MLKTTQETISDCIRHRGLPAAKIGRAWVLVDYDVIAWLRHQYAPVDASTARSAGASDADGVAARLTSSSALSAALAPQPRAPRGRAPR